MKVIITDKISSKGVELFKNEGYEVNEAWELPREEILKIISDYDAVVVRSATKVNAELIAAATKLKIVGRAGIGLDNVDADECEKRGIVVRNTPNATTDTVAELALGFMFALARSIVKGTTTLRNNEWAKKELKGVELSGKTVGIIGCGRIGSTLAKKCQALGMNVIGCEKRDWDGVFANSDFISIHVPHLPATTNSINAEAFEKMKKGVYIINCSRGGIIDEKALYDAIKSGKVKGAALDVWEKEPIETDYSKKLLELDEVIGTPHIGAQTEEGQARAGIQVAEVVIEELKKIKK